VVYAKFIIKLKEGCSMDGRHKVAVVVAEFVGTYVLATAMLAMLVRTNFEFFSAAAAAIVYGGLYLVFGSVSGSHLNPAVTLAKWSLRKISTVHAVAYIIAQLLAGLVAWKVAQYFLAQALSKTATGGVDWRVLIAEGVGGVVFGMAVAAVSFNKDLDTPKKAVVLAAGLFGGILVASLASNGLINPAAAIAARSVSWAYIVGPIVGLIVGANLYNLIFNENLVMSSPVSVKKASTKKKSSSKSKK
jgi:glycerol uptake facilitator-like aquaporin